MHLYCFSWNPSPLPDSIIHMYTPPDHVAEDILLHYSLLFITDQLHRLWHQSRSLIWSSFDPDWLHKPLGKSRREAYKHFTHALHFSACILYVKLKEWNNSKQTDDSITCESSFLHKLISNRFILFYYYPGWDIDKKETFWTLLFVLFLFIPVCDNDGLEIDPSYSL